MSFIAGILTFLLVINCLLLILLILMQLPKKDAGAGVAFGGAAADALFGAGSGNFLTQTTRYATIALFALSLVLGYLEVRLNIRSSGSEFENAVQQKQAQTPTAVPPSAAPANPRGPTPTNVVALPPGAPSVSLPATPATPPVAPSNAPAMPAQPK